MKVVAFNGSSRKDSNTALLIQAVLEPLQEAGLDTDTVTMAGQKIVGCTACMECFKNQDQRCVIEDDDLNGYLKLMLSADGIILGSPTYFADVTTEIKALIDRAGMVAKANGDMFKRKVGAAVVAVRRAGAVSVLDTINHFFAISQMIIPGSSYWNVGYVSDMGETVSDTIGYKAMRMLGDNMAWIIKKLAD